MAKIAIVTDSNSGISQKEGNAMGIFVIPMPFMVDGAEFFEDISLTQEQFYEKLAGGADVLTSQPSLENVAKMWDKVLGEYDEIVHIPMSSGLSSATQSALVLAEDYGGRVAVVDNLRISVVLRQSILDAIRLAGEGSTAAEIKQKLEDDRYNCSIYIMLDTLDYLKKGGRITPAAAMIGSVLKIKPVLQIQGDKLDAFARVRSLNQGKITMINAIRRDMLKRFGGADSTHVKLHIAHTQNLAEAHIFRDEVLEIYPDMAPIQVDCLSLSVACHIGPGALAIACTKN